MRIRCLVIDDEPVALDKLKCYIERVPYLEIAGLCESTFDAMKILSTERVDVMFTDINMPDMNGMDFVKSLVNPPLVVFTTAYAEYALESYKVHAADYLLKPFSFMDFQAVAENLRSRMTVGAEFASLPDHASSGHDFLYLKVDYRYVRVRLSDIIFIEGMNEYLKIHTVSSDPFLTHATFKSIKSALPPEFIQIHRSYVVNMNHVAEVERSTAKMTDGRQLPVSEGNREVFMNFLYEHTIGR